MFIQRPPHSQHSLFDNWITLDPFEIPTFRVHPAAPYTYDEITNFELIKADHIKELIKVIMPDDFY